MVPTTASSLSSGGNADCTFEIEFSTTAGSCLPVAGQLLMMNMPSVDAKLVAAAGTSCSS